MQPLVGCEKGSVWFLKKIKLAEPMIFGISQVID